MAALVLESFPEELRSRLEQTAAAHQRSVTQEAVHLLESALTIPVAPVTPASSVPYWSRRILLPEYEALLQSGALEVGGDSTTFISEERDAR